MGHGLWRWHGLTYLVIPLYRDSLGGFNLTSAGICACVDTLLGFELPLLLLGGGGYSGADASKCFAEVIATTLGVRETLPERIPEHEFYPKYVT